MVLRSVYYECRRNNWITWFVPSARVWTHRGSVAGCVRGRVPSDSDDSSRGRVFRAAGALSEASAGRRGAVWRRRLAAHHERPSAAERAREGALRPLPVLGSPRPSRSPTSHALRVPTAPNCDFAQNRERSKRPFTRTFRSRCPLVMCSYPSHESSGPTSNKSFWQCSGCAKKPPERRVIGITW